MPSATSTSISTSPTPNNDAPPDANQDREDCELKKQLDASVDRMRNHISDEPYILTIPQDEPKYHHYSRTSADAWLNHTPFQPTENYQVQYQTYFYQEPYSDLFQRVRYSHFDHGPQPKRVTAATDPSMASANTPTSGAKKKKKISLADYKNNLKQGKSALSTPVPNTHSSLSQDLDKPAVSCANVEEEEEGISKVRVQSDGNPVSRESLSTSAPANQPRKPKLEDPQPYQHNSPVPPKRLRRSISPQPNAPSSTPGQKSQGKSGSAPAHRLPRGRLSPLHPLFLPGRLSPTLPDQIVEALKEAHHGRSSSDSSTASTTRPKPTAANRPGSKHDSVLSNGVDAANEEAALATKAHSANQASKKPPPSRVDSSIPRDDSRPGIVPQTHDTEARKTVSEKGQSHGESLMVVLKIPKKDRQNFRRLVQFHPRASKDNKKADSPTTDPPGKPHQRSEPAAKHAIKSASDKRPVEDPNEPVKGVARKISVSSRASEKHHAAVTAPPTEAMVASKRPRGPEDDSLQPSSKRKKVPEGLKVNKDPKTPLPSEFRSPALPSSALKSQQATPTGMVRKEMRGPSTLKRVESTESFATSTPTMNDRTPASKSNMSQSSHANTRPSPSSTSIKTAESQAWWTEKIRLAGLAKELKDTAATHLNQATTEGQSTQKGRRAAERAALAALESFLAFILSFYCFDRHYASRNPPQSPDPQNWISFHGFWRYVKARSQPFPHLAALTASLAVVYNGMIMRRLATNGGSGKQHDPKILMEATSIAIKAAEEAATILPLSVVQKEYPMTWRRGMSHVGDDKSNALTTRPGQYDGYFPLTIGIQTDPVEAVRFGHAMLGEWCSRKSSSSGGGGADVDYSLKLKLST